MRCNVKIVWWFNGTIDIVFVVYTKFTLNKKNDQKWVWYVFYFKTVFSDDTF